MRKSMMGLLACIALSGCSSTPANHDIALTRPTDSGASCAVLRAEYVLTQQRLERADGAGWAQAGRNVLAGAAGLATLGLAWTAIDTGTGNRVDMHNAEARLTVLESLMNDKQCKETN